ncbi:MAG: hypothetical protein H8E73_01840 [Planctomycetes bacterium]|nr:hypothetical protein [Planctomycetota bacterium]MBL7187466.1 hypothetical protein [Phycisphaerae bacterium]
MPIESPHYDSAPDISHDCLTLYLRSDRRGGFGDADIWRAAIIPIGDLNGDGIVDAADMCIMVDHWGENYPLCDIGPMPWGDGVVDVEDLKVLAEHLFEDVSALFSKFERRTSPDAYAEHESAQHANRFLGSAF